MATTKVVSGANTGSIYLDSVLWGGRVWDQTVPIKVWLGDPNEYNSAVAGRNGYNGYFGILDDNGQPLLNSNTLEYWDPAGKPAEIAAIQYTLYLYESVCGLIFDRDSATSVEEADIVWWKADANHLGAVGIHENLASLEKTQGPGAVNQIWGYFNYNATSSWGQLDFGGDGLNTIIHEIGHGLGLAHPHGGGTQDNATSFPGVSDSSDLGELGLNQSVFTVMSYNPGLSTVKGDLSYGNQGGLGAFDIAALQSMYGKNMETAIGDNVYNLFTQNAIGTGWMCIWDAGGDADRISGRAATTSVAIDLRAANLKNNDPHAGGYISQQTGIAGGFTIANGVIIENAEGGDFDDTLIGNEVGNMLQGYKGADLIAGFAGADILEGGFGDDTLEGGEGGDQLFGDEGSDLASYSQATAGVQVNLGDSSQNTGEAAGDSYVSVEGVVGSDFNDTIVGTGAAEFISGGAGADILTGGGGDDVYIVEGHVDQIVELAGGGNDSVVTSRSASLATFANCETLIAISGTAAINLSGNAGSNKLVGNDGANILNGSAGIDNLQGGIGNDKLYGGVGNDVLSGGSGSDKFVFNSTLSSKSNKDKISDWSAKYDTIQLENAFFKALKKTGGLAKGSFVVGSKALQADDFVGYNKSTGDVWYDANGNKAGGQVVFANIGKYKAIAYNDLVVI